MLSIRQFFKAIDGMIVSWKTLKGGTVFAGEF
jgi:hypothetical protein